LIYRFGRTSLAAEDEMRKTAGPDESSVTPAWADMHWINILVGEPQEVARWMEAAARQRLDPASTPLSRTS
jgi:hypothetical protein